ncbi:glycosyltransferase family 4 protein [Roseivivax sediminis]|uniref:Glycosyltransferase involved in cell wall bisynthesis n=1 Tax=Roseivivax sediminis TaxID=936889 RepID=A0A1I1X6M9_9RHOB|nr:glycosyltransferase family 4 protein [Roseivivax sediminis]SFE00980.1 Glycosyltransferase involved in cell wall bisynthesis [Roseivivax sediminis]
MIRIAHLVDDTNPGGVTRYLDFLSTDPRFGFAAHEVIAVEKNRAGAVQTDAHIIVSHLAVSWRGLPGLMALRARHAGTPLVHVEHSYSEGFVARNVNARRRFGTLLSAAYAMFDRIVAVSQTQGEWLVRRGLVSDEALAVIPPCVDLSAFRALPAPDGPVRTVAALGRFHAQKGFDLLIRAMRASSRQDLRLVLIGDGPDRDALVALADGDPRISFAPFAADPAAALAQADAVAMPSRWEPFGLVALEARAAGRPVLVANVDGLTDQARDGAIAVAAPTVEAWTTALDSLGIADDAAPRATGREEAAALQWMALAADVLAPQAEGRAAA